MYINVAKEQRPAKGMVTTGVKQTSTFQGVGGGGGRICFTFMCYSWICRWSKQVFREVLLVSGDKILKCDYFSLMLCAVDALRRIHQTDSTFPLLNDVKRFWAPCWTMLNAFGHPVERCWTLLGTLSNDVEHFRAPYWMMLNAFGDPIERCWMLLGTLLKDVEPFGHPIEWCWTLLGILLNDVKRFCAPCWTMLNVFGHPVERCWTFLGTLLKDVERFWAPCWTMLNALGHPIEWCWTLLGTLLNDVERFWAPCWMMLNAFGHPVEWCWTLLGTLLNDVKRFWAPCWWRWIVPLIAIKHSGKTKCYPTRLDDVELLTPLCSWIFSSF